MRTFSGAITAIYSTEKFKQETHCNHNNLPLCSNWKWTDFCLAPGLEMSTFFASASLWRIQTLFGNREGSLFFIGQLMGPLGLVQYLFDASVHFRHYLSLG